MKKLHQIIIELNLLVAGRRKEKENWENADKKLAIQIEELRHLQTVALANYDIGKVQIAESILSISGNPYGNTGDPGSIAGAAIFDIAKGCVHLKDQYFGNKRYEAFYQRSDHTYGYGPKHGYIVDRIELRTKYMTRDLTSDEKDACIYYLANYQKIMSAKKSPVDDLKDVKLGLEQ